MAVGDALTEQLNKRGIKTVHDTTIHDESYNGSYDRSVDTVYKNLENIPTSRLLSTCTVTQSERTKTRLSPCLHTTAKGCADYDSCGLRHGW